MDILNTKTKMTNASPEGMIEKSEKKSLLKVLRWKLFNRDDKKKHESDNAQEVATKVDGHKTQPKIASTFDFYKNLEKQVSQKEIERKRQAEQAKIDEERKNFEYKAIEKDTEVNKLTDDVNKLKLDRDTKRETPKPDDEAKHFECKTIDDDDDKSERQHLQSHSSQDSGFSDKEEEKGDDEITEQAKDDDEGIAESLKKLTIDNKTKKKRLQNVLVSRAPDRSKYRDTHQVLAHPYQQINQVNRQTFSGGCVVVQQPITALPAHETYEEQDLLDVITNVRTTFTSITDAERENWLEDCVELINEDILSDFRLPPTEVLPDTSFLASYEAPINPMEDIENFDNPALVYDDDDVIGDTLQILGEELKTYSILTPPRSNEQPSAESPLGFNAQSPSMYKANVASFMSSPTSDYMSASPNSLSPALSGDHERYQNLPQFDDNEPEDAKEKKMTMKQFKDKQNALVSEFSKRQCCQKNRISCKEVLQGHCKKLTVEERSHLCFNVAKMELTTAHGVLLNVLNSLSKTSSQDSLHLTLFSLVCERILAQKPSMFIDEIGLDLLKFACFRCPSKPILARYIVSCVKSALNTEAARETPRKGPVFTEVDYRGDTLLIALARAGDQFSDCLAELVRRDEEHPDLPPLFANSHVNTEGHSALHVACTVHGGSVQCLHTTHVLLTHGDMDLWQGDVTGGDTPLHIAVNSVHCSLELVLLLFKQVDRKMWKQLAHVNNRSSVSPLEYARAATKATTRQNYPPELLNFLKKCR